jgi:hypothetical protein
LGAFFCNSCHLVTFNFAFSQFSVGAHGQPRGRVPDVVASRLLRPYHFRALIQSFQSVAAPFPGDSGFDRDCGARRSVGQRQAPRSRLAGEPIRRPSVRRKIRDGTNAGLFRYTESRLPGIPLDRNIYSKNLLYICFSFEISAHPNSGSNAFRRARLRERPEHSSPSGSARGAKRQRERTREGRAPPHDFRRLDSRDPVTFRTRRAARVWPPREFHAPRWKGSCRRD